MRWLPLIALVVACGSDPEYKLTREELLDPETCMECHPKQYAEWSGSMHAYAGDDPVFLAMNERGQEETNGELGDFCVNCHAPMAVRDGLTTDGLNLGELPQHYKGITCFFCHTAASVEDDHNNPIVLAEDLTMRGRYDDAISNGMHRTAYSPLHDSRQLESSTMCGSCHDIVTPAGVHLERTFKEYRDSVFSEAVGINISCSTCHMFSERDVIADFDGAPLRDRFEHTFAGIDTALTPWPEKDAQLAAIDRDMKNAINPRLCITPAGGGVEIEYTLDNVNAGHAWPSGAAADRRAWAEVRAWVGDQVVFETGVVDANTSVVDVAAVDTNLWQIRDYLFGEGGEPVHMFWDVRSVDSQLLPPAVTTDMTDPRFIHSVSRTFAAQGQIPDRVSAKLFIRPLGYDVIADLVGTGHLEPSIRDEIQTFEVSGAALEWTNALGFGCIPAP
jgi:hypothetical protein